MNSNNEPNTPDAQSGGVNISGGEANTGRDIVGRDAAARDSVG